MIFAMSTSPFSEVAITSSTWTPGLKEVMSTTNVPFTSPAHDMAADQEELASRIITAIYGLRQSSALELLS